MVTVLDKAGPGSAPRDLALQDDSKVAAPYANADAELPPGQSIADVMATVKPVSTGANCTCIPQKVLMPE